MLMSLFYNVVNVHALQLIIAETCINDVHAPKHDLSNLSHHIRSNVKTSRCLNTAGKRYYFDHRKNTLTWSIS